MYNGDEYIDDLRLNSFNGEVQHVIEILFTFKYTLILEPVLSYFYLGTFLHQYFLRRTQVVS